MSGHITKNDALKWAVYGVFLFFLYVIQTSYGLVPRPFGATIHFLPFLVAAVAMHEASFSAAVFGFFAGILMDAGSAGLDGIYMAYYTLLGAGFAGLSHRFFRRVGPVCLLLGGASMLVENFFAYAFYHASASGVPLGRALTLTGTQIVCSLPFGALIYLAVSRVSRSLFPEE